MIMCVGYAWTWRTDTDLSGVGGGRYSQLFFLSAGDTVAVRRYGTVAVA